MIYGISLIAGAVGYFGMTIITDKWLLLIPMVGIGVAWAGVLALPYAILSRCRGTQYGCLHGHLQLHDHTASDLVWSTEWSDRKVSLRWKCHEDDLRSWSFDATSCHKCSIC